MVRWNGTEWKKDVTFPTTLEEVGTVYAPSTVEVYIGGRAATTKAGVIYKWDGSAWTSVPLPALTTPANETDKSVTWLHIAGPAKPRQ